MERIMVQILLSVVKNCYKNQFKIVDMSSDAN